MGPGTGESSLSPTPARLCYAIQSVVMIDKFETRSLSTRLYNTIQYNRECSNPSKYEILAKTNEAFWRKWRKLPKHLIWTQNGQKQGDRIFFRAWCLNKKCREWSNPSKCEILAKTNEAFSRKWRKTAKNT